MWTMTGPCLCSDPLTYIYQINQRNRIMFCSNCGAEVPDNSRFCPKCGNSLSESPVYSAPSAKQAQGVRPPTYLVLSVIVTIFCCLIFGIIGIVYGSKVDPAWNAGLYDEAREYSRKARNWCLLGLLLNIILWILYVILVMAGLFSWASFWDNSYLYTACLF